MGTDPHLNRPAEHYTRTDVSMTTNLAIMVDNRPCVDDYVVTDDNPRLNDCASHYLRPMTQHCAGRHPRGRVHESWEVIAQVREALKGLCSRPRGRDRTHTVDQQDRFGCVVQDHIVTTKSRQPHQSSERTDVLLSDTKYRQLPQA